MRRKVYVIVAVLLLTGAWASAERVKDICTIKGERGNPLHGIGLVFGLNGTGDDSDVTKQAVASLLRQHNMTFDPDEIDAANVAAVVVTAELGPFDSKGAKIDVSVSTIGAASSLQGGKLLMTPLVGADKRVYAVAQGEIILGGFGSQGEASSIVKGHLTSGKIPNGAYVEREEKAEIVEKGEVTLLLKNADHETAERIVDSINAVWQDVAFASDAGTIRIEVPEVIDRKDINTFVSKIGQLEVEVDQPARVVINEKTGTIIVGQNVAISTVAIAHGNLTITVEERDYVVQPGPFSGDGATTGREHRTRQQAITKEVTMTVVPKTLTVTQLAQALNSMGLTSRDMIAIFQAIEAAGALQAELKVE